MFPLTICKPFSTLGDAEGGCHLDGVLNLLSKEDL
jgi:hypothetical protein